MPGFSSATGLNDKPPTPSGLNDGIYAVNQAMWTVTGRGSVSLDFPKLILDSLDFRAVAFKCVHAFTVQP